MRIEALALQTSLTIQTKLLGGKSTLAVEFQPQPCPLPDAKGRSAGAQNSSGSSEPSTQHVEPTTALIQLPACTAVLRVMQWILGVSY